MDIEFDSAKDAANIAKHGVSLDVGGFIIENAFHVEKDDRHDYGEERFNTFALIEGRLFVCTYTRRKTVSRIISVRKGSRQEQRAWQL